MPHLLEINSRLKSAPAASFHGTLVRCVGLVPLTAHGTPDYLFASARPNRFNPAGVACVYFSHDEKTARAEYGRRLGRAGLQPIGMFFAEARLAKVLDLANPKTGLALGLTARDLRVAWPLARSPTHTQLLGLALAQQTGLSAIRFASDAARAAGFTGFNIVIFRDCVRSPDYVKILGPTKKPLDQWP
jgi:RES domain-containing protein